MLEFCFIFISKQKLLRNYGVSTQQQCHSSATFSFAVTVRSFSISSAPTEHPPEELHTRVTSLIRSGHLEAASAMARQSVFSVTTRPTVFTCNAIIGAMHRAKRYNEAVRFVRFFL